MKKYIPLLILLFTVSLSVKAQTFSDDNFVYKAVPKKRVQSGNYNTLTKDDINQSVTFFDGLGRPVQTTAIGQGGNNTDVVTPIVYDGLGRQPQEYLPYPLANGTTTYPRIAIASSLTTLNSVYNSAKYENTANQFSLKQLEMSPLNRVLKQAAPGNAWVMNSGHEIKLDYQSNTDSEVRLFKATATWAAGSGLYDIAFSDAGNFGINQLYKTITYDENTTPGANAGIEEFKNKEGQVVLKRTYDAGAKHDIYYVYDTYGNLTYVIPPIVGGVIDADVRDGLCYQYKYDNRNRLVEKKLPGKQWEFIVYDKLDRPVATGPAFSPFKDDASIGWMITKYDALGRIIYTGWSNQAVNSTIRKTLQNDQNSATVLFENKQTSGSIDGILAYYTNAIEPKIFKLLTVSYYDNYAFPGAQTVPSTIEGQTVLTNVKTLATGSWTRAVTTPAAILGETNTIFYDEYARPIQNYNQNYLGGSTITNSNLDFAGKTIYTITKHKRTSGSTEITIREDFTYSPQDRLLTHTHQINGGVIQLMAANTYDNLGQLMSKNVGNSIGSPLQKVDFNYNIRGWLTEINKNSNLQQDSDPRDLFAFKINYNKIEGDPGFAKALYNGNIAETFWSSGLDGPDITRGYGYQYDQLNRLKNASYQAPRLADNKNYFGENMDYDKNGNIIRLQRNYMAGTSSNSYRGDLDNLGYFYKTNSNQLMKVTDTSNIPGGFKDDSNGFNDTVDDYDYDLNGNLIKDDNKGITNISYNHLNLPKKIIFGTTGNIEYVYNAAGQKVQKIVNETGKPTITTDYLGGFQYKDNVLEFFQTAEGYVKNTDGTLSYVFQYKDHLGNVRVNYSKNPLTQVLEIIDENNYYPFGLKHVSYMGLPESNNKYKFQGQERQDELSLNWDSFKYRNYDYAIGRFMCIDPLAEKYSYQSPYNFAENKVISHRELEGLEGIWFQAVMNADRAANPNGVSAHVMGITQGLVNSAKGLINAVANPVQTAKGIGNTALWLAVGSQASGAVDRALGTNSSGAGTALLNGVASGGNKLVNGNGTQRGAVIGEVAGAIIGAKGINATVNAIGKASTMSSLSNSVRATATELSTSGSVPSTVVGAELNGQTMIATSGAPQSVIAPQLEGVVGELGGIGTKTATGNTVGCCAEFQAGNNLLLENPNALPNQINFTNAIRPRTGQTIPMCDNCKTTFGK